MYLNLFLGPELAEKFKNAALYQPTTSATGSPKANRGVFGRLYDKARGKTWKPDEQAGSEGSVKDVTNKVVSYWMKYQLVNGSSANESWIKFAMPGKPLVVESDESPCGSRGWAKLTLERLAGRFNHRRLTASERFVESAVYKDGEAAGRALKSLVESKIAERFSQLGD